LVSHVSYTDKRRATTVRPLAPAPIAASTPGASFSTPLPEEVKSHLLEVAGELLSFEDVPEALEFRQSKNLAEAEAAQAGRSPRA
jgi:hypothetical protein